MIEYALWFFTPTLTLIVLIGVPTLICGKSCQAPFSRGIVAAKLLMVRRQTRIRKSRFEKM